MSALIFCVLLAVGVLYYKLHLLQAETRRGTEKLANEIAISRRTAQGLCSCALVNDPEEDPKDWKFLCPVCGEKGG